MEGELTTTSLSDEEIKNIFNNLGDLLCKNISGTDIKGDLVYKIGGVFESLRFRLDDLSRKVILEQEEIKCQI
jgi:hypothetical protein